MPQIILATLYTPLYRQCPYGTNIFQIGASLVGVLNDEEEGCEVEELDPVVDDHALDFQVNLRPEEGKDWIFGGSPLFQNSLVDEEYVSFLENEVQKDDERGIAE